MTEKLFTAFMLLLVIIVLIAALGAAVQAVSMQFAQRQLEAVRMQQTLEKLNKDFSAQLKNQEALRQSERLAAEKSAAPAVQPAEADKEVVVEE